MAKKTASLRPWARRKRMIDARLKKRIAEAFEAYVRLVARDGPESIAARDAYVAFYDVLDTVTGGNQGA